LTISKAADTPRLNLERGQPQAKLIQEIDQTAVGGLHPLAFLLYLMH
jgi:hypothetical protein